MMPTSPSQSPISTSSLERRSIEGDRGYEVISRHKFQNGAIFSGGKDLAGASPRGIECAESIVTTNACCMIIVAGDGDIYGGDYYYYGVRCLHIIDSLI